MLKYTYDTRKDFLKRLQKARAIKLLDLSQLERTTNSTKGDWYPQWKPDR